MSSTLLMGTPMVMLDIRTLSLEISALRLATSLFTLIVFYQVNHVKPGYARDNPSHLDLLCCPEFHFLQSSSQKVVFIIESDGLILVSLLKT